MDLPFDILRDSHSALSPLPGCPEALCGAILQHRHAERWPWPVSPHGLAGLSPNRAPCPAIKFTYKADAVSVAAQFNGIICVGPARLLGSPTYALPYAYNLLHSLGLTPGIPNGVPGTPVPGTPCPRNSHDFICQRNMVQSGKIVNDRNACSGPVVRFHSRPQADPWLLVKPTMRCADRVHLISAERRLKLF